MRRLAFVSLILGVVLSAAACGSGTGTAPPAASGAPASAEGPTATPRGTEPPVSAAAGKPIVTTNGKAVRVEGIGPGTSENFTLTGDYTMSITPCKATGVTPFIVLRSHTTNLAPTYVDAQTDLKGMSGEYDVEINPAPSCAWAVDFTPK
jgi:hypothetical protein